MRIRKYKVSASRHILRFNKLPDKTLLFLFKRYLPFEVVHETSGSIYFSIKNKYMYYNYCHDHNIDIIDDDKYGFT